MNSGWSALLGPKVKSQNTSNLYTRYSEIFVFLYSKFMYLLVFTLLICVSVTSFPWLYLTILKDSVQKAYLPSGLLLLSDCISEWPLVPAPVVP